SDLTPPRTVASSCARSASTSEATARAAAGPDSSAGPAGPAQPGTGTEMSRAGPMRCTAPVLHGTFFAPAPVAGRSRALPPRGWARSADDARCVGDLEAVRLAGAGVGERALVGVQALRQRGIMAQRFLPAGVRDLQDEGQRRVVQRRRRGHRDR